MARITINIEEKIYTKEELIKEVVANMYSTLSKGKYEYLPIDPDDFYTDYEFQKTEEK